MYKYQNVSGVTQTITTDGDISPRIVHPGEYTESSVAIESPNFKYVSAVQPANEQPQTEGTEE